MRVRCEGKINISMLALHDISKPDICNLLSIALFFLLFSNSHSSVSRLMSDKSLFFHANHDSCIFICICHTNVCELSNP